MNSTKTIKNDFGRSHVPRTFEIDAVILLDRLNVQGLFLGKTDLRLLFLRFEMNYNNDNNCFIIL